MVSYPSINFGDAIKSDLNSSNYLISAFAEEDDEDELEDETKDSEDEETEEDETKDSEDEETEEDETKDDEEKDDVKETKGDNLEDANDAIADAEEEIDRAQEKITEAKENKKDTSASEIALEEAQDKLKEAQENFELGLYGMAEELADEAEDLASDARMSLLGKSVEDIDDETEDELDDDKDEDEETEIEVQVKNDKAKVKIKFNGDEYRFVITDVSESAIIAAIIDKTGLTEDEIRATWDFETEDETEDDDSDKNELRTIEKIVKHENKAKETADDAILQLQQKIDQLEQRLQDLLNQFETGKYFGPVTNADSPPDSYSVSFTGTATPLDDASLVSDVDGDIYLESITIGSDSFKLRVTGGEMLIGDTFYDFVFGKARLVSSDGTTSVIVLGQIMDDQGNVNTIRLTLNTATPIISDLSAPVPFTIDSSRSKIAKQWALDATGDFTLLS